MQPLRVAYLLEDTDLSGGVRVMAAQADELIARGHQVTLVTKGPELTWRASSAEWRFVGDFGEAGLGEFDFVIASFWTTLEPAYALAGARALHLCQGYEGAFSAYQDIRQRIDAAYRLPVPKMVVSRHLVEVCRRLNPDVTWIGQIVDEEFFQQGTGGNERLRVLLPGAMEVDIKGVEVGYGAALHARFSGAEFDLVRVSPWRPRGSEPLEHVAEFHTAIGTAEMSRLLASCDVLIAPNRKEEGFGLPAAEAMASGVPVVATRIPSHLAFEEKNDFAAFADEDDAVGLGDALLQVIDDSDYRHRLIRRGREVAEQFRAAVTGARLEEYLLGRRR